MKWANEEIDKAIMLNKSGIRFKEIAKSLGRTTRAVNVKLNRLGINENVINYHETIECENCDNEFKVLKSNKGKFCSRSCSVTVRNKKNSKKRNKICFNCGGDLKWHQEKFCSHICFGKHKREEIFKKIEAGDTTLKELNYRNYLINKYGAKCMKCGWAEKHPITGKVPIQMNHKDGNSENHSLENLELLCPNCHALTPNFGNLNMGNGRKFRRDYYHKNK